MLWDTKQKGLALQVRPIGHRALKVIYPFHNRSRWLHLGDATAIDLVQARQLANEAMFAVARGKDPQAEKKAQHSADTFAELADRYRDEYAKKENKLEAGRLSRPQTSDPPLGQTASVRDYSR